MTSQSAEGKPFELRRLDDGVSVIAVRGELDAATEEEFREAVEGAIGSREGPLVVDLTMCSFIDSISIGVLASAQRSLEADRHEGERIAIVASRFPARALRLARVDLYIPVFATLDEALDAVRTPAEGQGDASPGPVG